MTMLMQKKLIGKFQNILRKISKTLDMLGSCAIVRIVNKTKQNQRSLETKQHENKNKKLWNIPENSIESLENTRYNASRRYQLNY